MSQTIELFNELLNDQKIPSITQASKGIGISVTSLSQFLSGKYKGNIEEVERKVANYLRLLKERELTQGDEIKWVDGIKNSELVLDIARLTHVQRSIGLVIGRSGLCKTISLKKYHIDHPDTIYIEADSAYNAKEVLREIHIAVGLNGVGNLNHLKKDIINKLHGSGRMIIIDQTEYISSKALDLIRTIHDKAGIGILLAGLPQLLSNIKGVGGVHEQIYTRIGAALELEPLRDEDVVKLVTASLPSAAGLGNEFIELSRRNARVLRILTRESKRIAKNKGIPINGDIVKRAAKQLVK